MEICLIKAPSATFFVFPSSEKEIKSLFALLFIINRSAKGLFESRQLYKQNNPVL